VGKKPPQSQKGGSHGLTLRTSAGLSPEEEKKKQFLFFFLGAGDLAELRWAARIEEESQFLFLFFIFYFGRWRPRRAPRGRLRTAGKPILFNF
jgi:hypothetical protein